MKLYFQFLDEISSDMKRRYADAADKDADRQKKRSERYGKVAARSNNASTVRKAGERSNQAASKADKRSVGAIKARSSADTSDLMKKLRREDVNEDIEIFPINEKLSVDDGIKTWIDDFQNSDAPQFEGKSKEKRREMAIAAYMDAKNQTKNEGFMHTSASMNLSKKMVSDAEKRKKQQQSVSSSQPKKEEPKKKKFSFFKRNESFEPLGEKRQLVYDKKTDKYKVVGSEDEKPKNKLAYNKEKNKYEIAK